MTDNIRFVPDDGGFVYDIEARDYVSDIFELLNELNNENKELKKENEQLKKQLNRLYNYFEDWYSEMTSANDFSEIWDNVKEDEQWSDVE